MSTELTKTNGNGALVPSTSLVPQNVEQALRLADVMAQSQLVPRHLQGKAADCFLVIEQAARWGMSPFAVAQCTSVISGKLMYEGKLVAAVVNARGSLEKTLDYRFEGEGERLKCFPFATLRGEDKPREIPEGVELAKVRTSNEMWRKQPHQQLIYAATRVWARRYMPELMLGVNSPEEMEPLERPKAQTVAWSPSVVPAASGAEPAVDSTEDEEENVLDLVWIYDPKTGEQLRQEPKRNLGQNNRLHALRTVLGIEDDVWRKRLVANFGKESSADLSKREADELIDKLEQRKKTYGTAADKKAKQQRKLEATKSDFEQSVRETFGIEASEYSDPETRVPGQEG